MSQLYYQHYFQELNSLKFTEKVIIIGAHPVITSLKLKPNNKFNSELYKIVQGHLLLLLQNLGLLFNLLTSKTIFIYNII